VQNYLLANPALLGNDHVSAAAGGWIRWPPLPGSPPVPALAEPTVFALLLGELLTGLLSLKIDVKTRVTLAGAA